MCFMYIVLLSLEQPIMTIFPLQIYAQQLCSLHCGSALDPTGHRSLVGDHLKDGLLRVGPHIFGISSAGRPACPEICYPFGGLGIYPLVYVVLVCDV